VSGSWSQIWVISEKFDSCEFGGDDWFKANALVSEPPVSRTHAKCEPMGQDAPQFPHGEVLRTWNLEWDGRPLAFIQILARCYSSL